VKTTKEPTELKITVSHDQDGAIVSLNGRLTIESSPSLRDRLLTTLHDGQLQSLTINLVDVPYIDCSGIATLIEALKIARTRNTKLQLSGLQDRVHYLLEVTGLLPFFRHSRDESSPCFAVTI